MKVLVACEFSGRVREAFAKRGHNAWSCDLLETEIPGQHIVGDVLPLLDAEWDLIIAHPPCTRLTNSGVRWLDERNLWDDMKHDAEFFMQFVNAPCEHIAVENPIPHKYAKKIIGNYTQIIQPYYFGEPETKATCLWLKGLSQLKATNVVEPTRQSIHREPP